MTEQPVHLRSLACMSPYVEPVKADLQAMCLMQAHNDMADVLDDWAVRFFQEMDYQAEAYNMMTFKAQMRALQGITVADVYPDLTSRRVLISEWCAGERLNNASPKDIRALCSTVLNCYLIQLLGAHVRSYVTS